MVMVQCVSMHKNNPVVDLLSVFFLFNIEMNACYRNNILKIGIEICKKNQQKFIIYSIYTNNP